MSFTSSLDEIVSENSSKLLGIRPGWKRIRFREVCKILNGYPFESSRFTKDRGTPLIRIRDILPGATETFYEGEFDPAFLVQPGELLIGMDGDFNCDYWRGMPALLNQRVCKVTPDESRYSIRFLRHVLPGYLAAIHAKTHSVTVKHLSSKTIGDIPLPFPSLAEQRRIVAELETQITRLDASVTALKRVQANLKRYRASVLKAACEGRLVPTDGMQAIKPPESYTPRLPAGWTYVTVGDVAEKVQFGSSAKTSENRAEGVPVLRMGNIQNGRLELSELKYLPASHAEFPELLLQPGDVLFNRTNSAELVGKTAVYSGVPEACSFASYLIRVRLTARCAPKFLSYYINSTFGRAWINSVLTQQVGQANVNGTKLKALVVPLPPIDLQHRIVAEVERRLSVIEELEATVAANLKRAERLRQSVLARAFSQPSANVHPNNVAVEPQQVPAGELRTPPAHFFRALLSGEIVYQLHAEKTFGRVKHQKIFHLCEHIARLDEIKGQYHREAQGPLDNKLIYANEAELKKQKWFEAVSNEQGYGHHYRPMAKAGAHAKYLERHWPEQIAKVRELIELMRSWSTERCEIFATAYAAWNDLLIWGREPSDEAILEEILNHWHDSKRDILESRWRKAIGWMREHGYEPVGYGVATRKL